jgi:hypothetical protein
MTGFSLQSETQILRIFYYYMSSIDVKLEVRVRTLAGLEPS